MKRLTFSHYLSVVALLLLMLAQLATASPSQSAAFDEGYTITYGYAYLRGGDARLSRGQNPPLTNVLIALPLLLKDDIVFPAQDVSWLKPDIFGFSDQFMWRVNLNPQRMVLLARLPEMMLALLLACVLFAFTRLLFGERAALAALLVCAFDPNILAHGHIVGTDLGVTFFMFVAMWQWTLALKRNQLKHVIAAGVLTGAAFATKYSAVWLVPIALGVSLIYPDLRRFFGRRLIMGLLVGVMALIVIWGTFAFSLGPIDPGGLSVPAPQYWQSLSGVRTRVELSTPAFMLGQISASGFLGYYPFVFLVKTPLPTLILLVIGVVSLVRRRSRKDVAAWFPPLLFVLAAIFGGLNLGYRLMLPVLPFALMIAGQGVNAVLIPSKRIQAWRPGVVAVLSLWLIVDVVSINPNHVAYFNQLINRERDYEVLVDSNLDWGQDLIALRDWQRARQLDDLNVVYYGSARPEAYDLKVNLLPSFSLRDYGPEINGFTAYALKPGWYAVSVSSLQLGLLYSRWGLYTPFKNLQPVERVGRSFLIYHVTYPSHEIDRTVSLGPQAGDLDAATLGQQAGRRLIVKWAGEDAAVIDMQGSARYVVRGGEPIFGLAPQLREVLTTNGTRLGNDASGDLRLWQIDASVVLTDVTARLDNTPLLAPDQSALHLPIDFEGGLTLIGCEVTAQPDQPIELTTYWRVRHTPLAQFSIFAHVYDDQARFVAQRDGLNVNLNALETGDIVVQRLIIAQPAGATTLRLGLYDPGSMQRRLTADSAGARVDEIQVALR
ncbi:MAG: glycosyltransferase family 39 protein [Thermoflexales bacterium]|nr:glycosyltransferase family 39 protein [Thermoflexales bacterium]